MPGKLEVYGGSASLGVETNGIPLRTPIVLPSVGPSPEYLIGDKVPYSEEGQFVGRTLIGGLYLVGEGAGDKGSGSIQSPLEV
jgi:hypothetical protein